MIKVQLTKMSTVVFGGNFTGKILFIIRALISFFTLRTKIFDSIYASIAQKNTLKNVLIFAIKALHILIFLLYVSNFMICITNLDSGVKAYYGLIASISFYLLFRIIFELSLTSVKNIGLGVMDTE